MEPTREPDAAGGPAGPFVVGVGASAGGLEALGELIGALTLDGLALVVVQHLSPQHQSALAELLGRSTTAPISTAADGLRVEAGHVYVIAPNTELALEGGVLRVRAPPSPGLRFSIDTFFRSLARDRGAHCAAVVLSGTGTDGTLGLEAVKAAGGLTLVQEPKSARFDGMPQSALASGEVDVCLPPRELARELMRLSAEPRTDVSLPSGEGGGAEVLAKLSALMRSGNAIDLTAYKSTTLERRIERRMLLTHLSTLDDYVRFAAANPQELRALERDLMIRVTRFFRDQTPFEALQRLVLSRLVQRATPTAPLRIWVPACSTGEEAYSIAILATEAFEKAGLETHVQLFATDVDLESVTFARRGIYPHDIAADVSPERLERFFVKRDTEYQVTREVRERIIFSAHNALRDAPLSRLDLISCRNLLIYLRPPVQQALLARLHFALNPVGYLMLGNSESVGDAERLFALVDAEHKLYAKKHAGLAAVPPVARTRSQPAPSAIPPLRPVSLQALADRRVLELYGPPGVVVSASLDIVQYRGRVGAWLDPKPGTATLNLLRLVRAELYVELKRLLDRALAERQRITATAAVERDGQRTEVELDVVPLETVADDPPSLLVLFNERPPPATAPAVSLPPDAASAERLAHVERELARTQQFLQETLAEKDVAADELTTANELLQSANEELQSINEELETSKEEVQSTNEELVTVNDELQTRMTELVSSNDDLHNLLTGIEQAVVIVSLDLKIRRLTDAASRLLDVGREPMTVARLGAFLGDRALEQHLTAVMSTLQPHEAELLCANQRWYAVRIRPYLSLDRTVHGAIVGLADIDIKKRAADVTRDLSAYASRFLGAIDQPLMILDGKLTVLWANDDFFSTFQLTGDETLGQPLAGIAGGQLATPALVGALRSCLASGEPVKELSVTFRSEEPTERSLRIGASRLPLGLEGEFVLVAVRRHR